MNNRDKHIIREHQIIIIEQREMKCRYVQQLSLARRFTKRKQGTNN